MKIKKSNGEMSAYIPGAVINENSIRFNWSAELEEDFKDDPNVMIYFIEGRKAYIIFTFRSDS